MTVAVLFLAAAGLGAATRHVVRLVSARVDPIPLGTLVVNLTGSFLLGIVVGWDAPASTVVGTAGIGALTTFSTFSSEILELRAEGRAQVAIYVTVSVVGGVTLAWLGLQV